MMKRILLIFMMVAFTSQAQFKKLSLEVGVGGHLIADESGVLDDNSFSMNFIGRYNLNRTFGIGGVYAFDNLTFTTGKNTSYGRLTFEGWVDLWDIMKMDEVTPNFTILAHGGVGGATFGGEFNGVVTGGLTGIYNLNDEFAIKLDYTTVGNFAQNQTLNRLKETTNAGLNSVLYNFSVGLVVYVGDREEKPADFYPGEYLQKETIIEKYTKETVAQPMVTNITQGDCECDMEEYVFFDHDSDQLNATELNTVTKVFAYLKENPEKTLNVNGFASATASSDGYNFRLSQRRIKTVTDKLILMGLYEGRIKTNPQGKDKNWADNKLHDVSRRVELIIN